DTPQMWSTHPSNYDREQSAKETYLRCPIDERSPWALFDDPVDVRERVTWRFYRVTLGLKRDVLRTEAESVQEFIDDEHAETTYDPKYQGLYDGRFLEIDDLAALRGRVKEQPWK